MTSNWLDQNMKHNFLNYFNMIFKLFMSPLRHFSIKSFVLIDDDDEFFFVEWLSYKKP